MCRVFMSLSSMESSEYKSSTYELDSHANMIVLGKQAFVFNHTGQYENVKVFSEDAGGIPKVPIVDAVISYYCPHSGGTRLLIERNYLCVPLIAHNLPPPFILREAGLILNDTPKIHFDNPIVEDHSFLDE